jgi:pimeloyl-ACP methyl ester carboxylesterase
MGGALSPEMAKRGRARSVTAISPGGGWAEGDGREVNRIIRLFSFNQKACPVQVTWGEQDRTLPLERHADHFKTTIRGVRFKTMPGLGHTPMWDDAAQIAQAIADFAEEAQAAASPASTSSVAA